MYLVSVLVHAFVIFTVVGIILAFGIRIPQFGFISLLFVLANPMWICAFTCFIGMVRRKKALVVTGTLSGFVIAFLFINNLTATLWYSSSTYKT